MPLTITIRAKPASSRQYVNLDSRGTIKLHIISQPEKGKANDEILAFFAKTLSCAKKEIRIISGYTSPTKKITFETINSIEELFKLLKLDRQTVLP